MRSPSVNNVQLRGLYRLHILQWTLHIMNLRNHFRCAVRRGRQRATQMCVCVVHRTGRRQVQQHNSRSSASALHCDLLALIHTTSLTVCTWWPKFFWYPLTSSTINRFWKLFHCRNQEKTCNNTITKDPTTPQVCRYTTLWSIKCLKSNNWKRDDFCNNTLHMLIN